MIQELFFRTLWLVVGAYLGWSVAECLSLRLANQALTPYADYGSLWLSGLLAPVLAASRARYTLLYKMRIYKTQPAAVFSHRDPVLGIDWVVLMTKTLKKCRVLQTWHRFFTESVGHTFWLNSFGSWLLMTCEPDIKAILSGQFDSWPIDGLRQKSLIPVLGPHAIFTTDSEWARSRAMIRPSFVRNQIADLECTDRHVENLLARLRRQGGGESKVDKVDLQELFYMFTMDTPTDFMFGQSTDMLVSPSTEAVEFCKMFDYAMWSTTNRSRIGWLLSKLPNKKVDKSVAVSRAFIDHHVAAVLAQDKAKERPYVFMNELVDSGASHAQISDQLLSMILGGRDTSASLMSSLFWVLARRPEVVRAIRRELDGLDGRRPSWEELKGLKYLNYVIKEGRRKPVLLLTRALTALRLWPPVPTNMRTASRDLVLPKGGGPSGDSPLFVPKGTECRFSMYSLHRRKDIYGEDAEEFRPERWQTLRTSWAYVPFSGGPQICIGQQFALAMMLYLTARFFQVFAKIEARDERPMMQMASATMRLPYGCWVSLTPA